MTKQITILATRGTPGIMPLILALLLQEPKRRFKAVARIRRQLKVEANS